MPKKEASRPRGRRGLRPAETGGSPMEQTTTLEVRVARIEAIVPTLATKADLASMRTDIDGAMAKLATKEELRAAVAELPTRQEMRTEIREAVAALEIRLDRGAEETRREFARVHEAQEETRQEFARVHEAQDETRREFARVHEEFASVRREFNERIRQDAEETRRQSAVAIRAEGVETRRHFTVVAEAMEQRFRIAMEAWDATNERVTRETEARERADGVLDTRVTRLEARNAHRGKP